MTTLKNNLDHSRAAYLFAVRSLPSPSLLQSGPVCQNGVQFTNKSQIDSMLIELGWAFFCRYEACLERFLKDHRVHLSKTIPLRAWLKEKNISIPCNLEKGIDVYRDLRNALHHEDPKSVTSDAEKEPHLLPNHMEMFYKLFLWIGQQVVGQ